MTSCSVTESQYLVHVYNLIHEVMDMLKAKKLLSKPNMIIPGIWEQGRIKLHKYLSLIFLFNVWEAKEIFQDVRLISILPSRRKLNKAIAVTLSTEAKRLTDSLDPMDLQKCAFLSLESHHSVFRHKSLNLESHWFGER